MFGHRYFGSYYFGVRYFGPSVGSVVPVAELSRRYIQSVFLLYYFLIVTRSDYVIQVDVFRYTILAPAGPTDNMPPIGNLSAIAPNQKQTMGVDFGLFLPDGVTLVGTPTLTLTVGFGTDPDPASRVISGPTIGTISTDLNGSGISDTSIIFQVATCLPGVNYIAELYCLRSDGDIAEASTRFRCNAPS